MSTPATPVALTGANQQAFTGVGEYAGIVIEETAGATGRVRIWDGTSATGTVLDIVDLTAHASVSLNYTRGRRFALGVFVEVVAGTVAGSVLLG